MKTSAVFRCTLVALFPLSIGCFTACVGADPDAQEAIREGHFSVATSGVTFRTAGGGQFVGAQYNGGGAVIATATVAQAWEKFTLDDLNGGALESGDRVTIRAGGGQYFKAQNGGGSTLSATATTPLGWETFTIIKVGTGTIGNGDVVGLRAQTGHFVRAQNAGGGTVDAAGAELRGWEQLIIGGLSTSTPTSDPTCSTGIRQGDACCPAACGACGGTGCSDRPGGASACCANPILASGISCDSNLPPCIVGGSTPPGDNLVWRTAELTNYTSYPDPGSDECVNYNGCTWAGYFAALDGQQSESWVQSHNIIAVHSKDFEKYRLKTIRLKQGTKQIDAVVYDMCSDNDCDGCCTRNAQPSGYLIDVEKYTMQRFGSGSGQVQWACLDCGSNP